MLLLEDKFARDYPCYGWGNLDIAFLREEFDHDSWAIMIGGTWYSLCGATLKQRFPTAFGHVFELPMGKERVPEDIKRRLYAAAPLAVLGLAYDH